MAERIQALTDNAIREAILASLSKDPELKSAKIEVGVEKGIVALNGTVDQKAEKLAAERAAIQVPGVIAVADSLELRKLEYRPEVEIVRDIFRAIGSNITLSADRVRITVSDGRVTLDGSVSSSFQKLLTEAAVRRLPGIESVTSHIEVEAQEEPAPESGVSEVYYEDIVN